PESAVAAAILAGDLAHILADDLLARSGFDPTVVLGAFVEFNRMRADAVAGEFIDVSFSGADPISEAEVRALAFLKTGSYSVFGPLIMGLSLGRSTPELRATLGSYGRQ